MARSGTSAELLYRRAIEYRALRDWAHAEADLNAALVLSPDDSVSTIELARILIRQPSKAFHAALLIDGLQRRFELIEPRPAFYADLVGLEAELNCECKAWEEAVAAFSEAIALRGDTAWYLLRSRAQAHLPEQRQSQLAGLRSGYTTTQSPVLLRELCDALLSPADESSAAERREAAEIVEEELAANRYRSAWLLRRAQLHTLAGRSADAEADLREALAELAPRIHPTRPDVDLVIQRGTARALLGQVAEARADLRQAEWAHAPDWMLAPLVEALGDRTAPTAVSPDD
ncbi:MAG: hypothetical protein C0483_12085 [Pirellula sp.]|nr:hypothetical protein [Pirellula sp.]